MKKILITFIVLMFLQTIVFAEVQKIAILKFEKNDRPSDYITKALMSRDFKSVFKEYDDLELIDLKKSKKALDKSGVTNLSSIGKEEIAKIGEELGANIVIWGTVSSISSSEFKIIAKIFSMKSKGVEASTFIVKKDSKQRKEKIKKNLITKIQELGTGEIDELMSIGIQHFNSKNFDSAEETFLNLIKIDDKNVDGYLYLGLIKYLNKDYEKSIEYYLSGLDTDPSNKNILDYLSKSYVKMENYEDAVEVLIKITEMEEDNKDIWLRIGNIYSEIEYYEEAQEAFEKAIEIDSEFCEAYIALGVLFFDQDSFDAAIEPLEYATDAFPEIDHLQKKLAKCYYKTGKLDSAINKYKEVLLEQPDNINAYINLAGAYRITNKNQEALETLLNLKELAPELPKVYFRLADTYIALGNYSKARECSNKAVELDPDLFESYKIIASIDQSLGYEKYEKFLDYEEMYQDKSVYYGAKADELVEKRDKVKTEANAYFKQANLSLDKAVERTDDSSILKDIKKNRVTLKQLLEATKSGGF